MIEYPLFEYHNLCKRARFVGGTSRYLCECPDPLNCEGVKTVKRVYPAVWYHNLKTGKWPGKEWKPFDVTFSDDKGELQTWIRFAPSREFAEDHARAVLAYEYGESAYLVHVQERKGGI